MMLGVDQSMSRFQPPVRAPEPPPVVVARAAPVAGPTSPEPAGSTPSALAPPVAETPIAPPAIYAPTAETARVEMSPSVPTIEAAVAALAPVALPAIDLPVVGDPVLESPGTPLVPPGCGGAIRSAPGTAAGRDRTARRRQHGPTGHR